jgi:F0F1-type ATP synthase membrane subunit b/b'
MKKALITSVAFLGLLGFCYYYYTVSENHAETISSQKALVKNQENKIKELESQILFEKVLVADQKKKLEEYNNRVQGIKTVIKPVVVYKEIVKTLPAEVIVEKANEDTNEIIDSISNSAADFNGVHNN